MVFDLLPVASISDRKYAIPLLIQSLVPVAGYGMDHKQLLQEDSAFPDRPAGVFWPT